MSEQDKNTLRDEFALRAMQSMLMKVADGTPFSDIAKMAYAMADAMLKARGP